MKLHKKYICLLMTFLLIISLFACSYNGIDSSDKSGISETDFANGIKSNELYIEHLNNIYEDYKEMTYGLDITKKTDLVGICYTTWFSKVHSYNGKFVNNYTITDILVGNGEWGQPGQFHYWSEPALGFYTSDNKNVIRTHMTQISEMGADYIIIDNTNATMNWKRGQDWYRYITLPCTTLLDTIVEMRAEGLNTPYVVFWNKTTDDQNWDVVSAIYDEFISVEKWKDCFVYWEGKPFVLTTSVLPDNPPCDITTRKQWGLNQNLSTCEWSFLNIENKPSYDNDGFAEQISVATAAQETYMSVTETAHGRNHGIFMYNQWLNAFKYRPKAVTITWWNEWCAQLFLSETGTKLFVDNYTQEYSRDIEPMKGGHRDQYYQWTKQYIEAYKNHENCPRLVESGY